MPDNESVGSLTSGSLWDNIWKMSWPMLMVMGLNFLAGLTDIYVAGFLGPEIQAVVGYVSQLYFFIIIAANAISIGTVALLSRAVGAGRQDEALHTARQSLAAGFLCALGLMALCLLLYGPIISVAGFPENIRTTAEEFIIIFAFALAPNYMVIIANAVFRAGGEVRLMLLVMFVVSIINILLNFIFVFSAGLGYRGIALATASAMTAGMFLGLFMFRRSRWHGILRGPWSISGEFIRRIIRLSWPAAVLQLSWNTGGIVLYNILSRLETAGITAMAAFSNGLRIEAIIYLPAFALNMAASVLTGQNLGAGLPKRAETIGWKITIAGVLFVSVISLPVYLWPEVWASPVAQDQRVLTETAGYLRIMMLSEPFMALGVILGGCLQGAGDTKGTMLVIIMTMWVIRLPLAYLLSIVTGLGSQGVWLAMVISMSFHGIVMALRFRQGRWKELKP